MKLVRLTAMAAVGIALGSIPALAQYVLPAQSGTIQYLEGNGYLNNSPIAVSPTHFEAIREGSVMRTADGRAEVLLTPGVVLRLAENSSIRMMTTRLVDTRVEFLTGSAEVVVDASDHTKDSSVTVVHGDRSVVLMKGGVYRFDAEPARLRVFRGSASVQRGGETEIVTSGKVVALEGDLGPAVKFDLKDTDSLDYWTEKRAQLLAMANVSAARNAYGSFASGTSGWVWNRYFSMYTFVPAYGQYCNPFFDYCYYSPLAAYRTFFVQPPSGYNGGNRYPGVGSAPPSSGGMTSSPALSAPRYESSAAPVRSVGSSAPAASPSAPASAARGSGR